LAKLQPNEPPAEQTPTARLSPEQEQLRPSVKVSAVQVSVLPVQVIASVKHPVPAAQPAWQHSFPGPTSQTVLSAEQEQGVQTPATHVSSQESGKSWWVDESQ